MRICSEIFDEIVNVAIDAPPEIGGIIGGENNVVKAHYMDMGISSAKACSYTPNVSLLNGIISEWSTDGIQFMGIYHTHFFEARTLSEGDIRYIRNILLGMPDEIDSLYFPLVVFPSRTMVSFKAIKKLGSIEIYNDNLVLI